MLQNILEIVTSGVILLVLLLVFYKLGVRAKEAGEKLEPEVLKLPLPNPAEIDDAHISKVLEIRRRWQVYTLLGGLSTTDFWLYLVMPIILLISDYVSAILLGMLVFLLIFLTSSFLEGLARIMKKRRFWKGEMNPVKGIEVELELLVKEMELIKPKESSSSKYYPEAELVIYNNWKLAYHSSLNRTITIEIYRRELTPNDRQLLLEYLVQREDIIGQIAKEVQEETTQSESAEH